MIVIFPGEEEEMWRMEDKKLSSRQGSLIFITNIFLIL